jgi:hypothetical protein
MIVPFGLKVGCLQQQRFQLFDDGGPLVRVHVLKDWGLERHAQLALRSWVK